MTASDPFSQLRRPTRRLLIALLLAVGVTAAGAATGCKRSPELPVLSTIPEFTFTDQAGKPVGKADLRGKVSVAAFMFTRCPTICPKITMTMRELQQRAKQASLPVQWLSFTVDPENDTPSVLTKYAQEYNLDLDNWSLLTGDPTRIREVAEQGFKIAAEGTADPDVDHYGISHGSHLVLVDGQGQIRGYYRTLDGDAQKRLIQDLKTLTR